VFNDVFDSRFQRHLFFDLKMKRLKTVSGMFMAFFITPCVLALAQQIPPNIVFIVVDDLGYSDVEYSNYKEGILTPNINRIVENGMLFTDAYAAAPVCSPTRASIMTGKSPAALKLTCHIPGQGIESYLAIKNKGTKLKEAFFIDHLPLEELTIAEVLKEQGYKTGYIGKWHLAGDGSANTVDGIVDARYHPDYQGFDVNIGGCAYGQPKSYFSPYSNGTIIDGAKGEYLTDRLGDEAIHFIEENKETPFFLNLATYTVHTPLAAPVENINNFSGNKYYAMIEKLDQNIGKVIDKLEALDLLDNTMVIFYSDNGGLWGNAPLKGGKGTLNEGGLRVPLVISWPELVKAGSTCCIPVTSVDFFPTFLDLVGVSQLAYPQLEGISILPLLKGENASSEKPLYWYFPHHRSEEGVSMGAAIRKGKWKYIYEFETGKEYLYNLEEDLSELFNLVDEDPVKVRELSIELEQWLQKVDAEIPELNQ
jgi:arylsulfatase A-like enzyme